MFAPFKILLCVKMKHALYIKPRMKDKYDSSLNSLIKEPSLLQIKFLQKKRNDKENKEMNTTTQKSLQNNVVKIVTQSLPSI